MSSVKISYCYMYCSWFRDLGGYWYVVCGKGFAQEIAGELGMLFGALAPTLFFSCLKQSNRYYCTDYCTVKYKQNVA